MKRFLGLICLTLAMMLNACLSVVIPCYGEISPRTIEPMDLRDEAMESVPAAAAPDNGSSTPLPPSVPVVEAVDRPSVFYPKVAVVNHADPNEEGSIARIISQLEARPGILVLSGAGGSVYTVAQSLVIPSNVRLVIEVGALITLGHGVNLTIHGPFNAAVDRCFSGEGGVLFGWGALPGGACAEWFGAYADNSHPDETTAAWKKCLQSIPPGYQASVRLASNGYYRINDTLSLPNGIDIGGGSTTGSRFVVDRGFPAGKFVLKNEDLWAHMYIHDFMVDASENPDVSILRVKNPYDYFFVQRVVAAGFNGSFLDLGGVGALSQSVKIEDCCCYASSSGRARPILKITNANEGTIINNKFLYTQRDGLEINSVLNLVSGFHFYGNSWTGPGKGGYATIQFKASQPGRRLWGNTVIGNTFEACDGAYLIAIEGFGNGGADEAIWNTVGPNRIFPDCTQKIYQANCASNTFNQTGELVYGPDVRRTLGMFSGMVTDVNPYGSVEMAADGPFFYARRGAIAGPQYYFRSPLRPGLSPRIYWKHTQSKDNGIVFESESRQKMAQMYPDGSMQLRGNLITGGTGVRFPVLSEEPEDAKDGDVVYADGIHWNPGRGPGFYGRENGRWVKF